MFREFAVAYSSAYSNAIGFEKVLLCMWFPADRGLDVIWMKYSGRELCEN